MSCTLSQGFDLNPCKTGFAGLAGVYLTNWENVASITEASGIVTAITLKPGKAWYLYQLPKETSEFKETVEVKAENEITIVRQELKFIVNSRAVDVRGEMMKIAWGRVLAVVSDRLGIKWVLGATGGMECKTIETGSGLNPLDRSGYQVNLYATEPELSFLYYPAEGCADGPFSNLFSVSFLGGCGDYVPPEEPGYGEFPAEEYSNEFFVI